MKSCVMPKRLLKRGRRPGKPTTVDDIRKCAAVAFARSGYDGVTIRDIAAVAGVDAALVFHYFGTKKALFEASLDIPDLGSVSPLTPVSKDQNSAAGNRLAGERIVRDFLATWDAPNARKTIAGLLRTASADEGARALLTDVIARTVVAPAMAGIDARRGMPKLRAALVASQLFGIAWMRYVLESEPIASASASILGRTFGPSIDTTLRGVDYGTIA